MFSNRDSSSSLNTLAHLAEYRTKLSLPAYRYLFTHEDTLNRNTRIETRCQIRACGFQGSCSKHHNLYSSTVQVLEYNYFARINSLPPPLPGTTPPSRRPHPSPNPSPSHSNLTRLARQALHRQADASFRLHIGSPPPPPLFRFLSRFFPIKLSTICTPPRKHLYDLPHERPSWRVACL